MIKRKKKRNPADLTLRNLRALKKRLAELERRVERLEVFLEEFELVPGRAGVFSPRDFLPPGEDR
jgi:hypothetical protein